MDKQELIEKIKDLPEDIQVYIHEGNYDDLDVRIFIKPKDQAFRKWYFGP